MKQEARWVTPEGQEFVLILECPDLTSQQESDLTHDNARGRIADVCQREVQRCGEIAFAALNDAHMARRREDAERKARIERKRIGAPEPRRGPNQVLGPGTKDQAVGRYVEHEGQLIPAPEAIEKGIIDG